MDPKLAAIIVHDLKNALGILEGELHDMAHDIGNEQTRQAYRTCVSLREKLVGFLTLYKASSQGLRAHVDAVSPKDFLHALLQQHASSRPELQMHLNTEGMPALGFFDENLVSIALEAALQNAARFARSRIEVGCRMDAGQLVFAIRDDGPGLGVKEESPSTGLGMELCEAIAQAHGKGAKTGTVVLRNAEGGGALFELWLP